VKTEAGFREGLLVREPFVRLNEGEVKALDRASMSILEDIGIFCYNEEATGIFAENGCRVSRRDERSHLVQIPSSVLGKALSSAPSKVKLGARDPRNSLVLDAEVPRIYFGSGSETNVWLDTEIQGFVSETDPEEKRRLPVFSERRGTVERLSTAARLAEQLENLDFFIRPVNIQDEDINEDNHDVNKFYASLANMTKHVQAGLTSFGQLDNVILMAETIAGSSEALRENPIISFITCTIKSPLQMVADATEKMMGIVRRGLPVVISSSPQGGTSAPISEAGMVAQINAEILCGIALSQMVRPGAPVLYGSVPVRARMDNLHDLYGAPEFNQYNVDCIQMARHYRIPCYSTAGVGDTRVPGLQATVEKMFTHIPIAMAGAQYIHYAFGLLDRTNTFCPLQAVLDDQHIGMVKRFLAAPRVGQGEIEESMSHIRKVMGSKQGLFVRFVRKSLRSGLIYSHYPFEDKDGGDMVIERALGQMEELLRRPTRSLPLEVREEVFRKVPGLLPRLGEA
jgi:trimethylamine--corrinoid protein Co-methyltransferase